jgi:hypothetical protein
MSARAANSWLDEPKVFQNKLQIATGFPAGSVRLIDININGTPPINRVERIRPVQPFQPVSS